LQQLNDWLKMSQTKNNLKSIYPKKINENISIIDRRTPHSGACELCAKIGEGDFLRPYGPKGEWICFDCGMLDEKTTEKRCNQILFGKGLDS
jgi:hypothetical protein